MTIDGHIGPRKSLTSWLPDTIEDGYQVYPAIWEGEVLEFTADDGKIKYCVDGDEGWTDCGGDNTITTQNGGKPIFLRVLDVLLVINGGNGDKLCYVKLSDKTVVKYAPVTDPTVVSTAAATGITNSGAHKIYYGYTFSSATGETKISPILTYTISKPRDQWKTDGSDGQGFIAHELQAVVPDCVTGTKDAVDADGKPQYQGVDTSFLVATLVAAIQELKAEIDLLKGN